MLFSSQTLASLSLIGLDALLILVSPLENFLNPPPVPETPTVTRTLGSTALNSSATASVTGYTVLEPSILISPDKVPELSELFEFEEHPINVSDNSITLKFKKLFSHNFSHFSHFSLFVI